MTHPDPTFRRDDPAALRDFARAAPFAQIAVIADGRPLLAQAPILVTPEGGLQFHLASSNAASAWIENAPIVVGLLADDFYVSPDWYAAPGQVPTWNYRLAEAHGVARRLSDAELAAQVAALSEAEERKLLPKPVWTVDALPRARFAAMLRAIVGFGLDAPEWRGTAKLGQNKPAADRRAVARALRERDRPTLAALMEPHA